MWVDEFVWCFGCYLACFGLFDCCLGSLGGLCSLVAMVLLSGCGYLIVVTVCLDCVCCYSKCVDLLSWCLWWCGLLA